MSHSVIPLMSEKQELKIGKFTAPNRMNNMTIQEAILYIISALCLIAGITQLIRCWLYRRRNRNSHIRGFSFERSKRYEDRQRGAIGE